MVLNSDIILHNSEHLLHHFRCAETLKTLEVTLVFAKQSLAIQGHCFK